MIWHLVRLRDDIVANIPIAGGRLEFGQPKQINLFIYKAVSIDMVIKVAVFLHFSENRRYFNSASH